jgi:ERCC4-related helicase
VIDLAAATALLDFGSRIPSEQRAREQLEGAVALHNLLEQHKVAYLADEVGMGKTFVALGVIALFRHFDPGFRVLVIAPRENIQIKWEKEMRNFVAHNVRIADLRVRGLGGAPARALVHCSNLLELLRETSLDGERDFFARTSSFSLPLGQSDETWVRLRANLRERIGWLSQEALDLRGNKQRKDQFARAINCALPVFDLVIVDEAHNLKHGFQEDSAARNRVLALAFGHGRGETDLGQFPAYGPRARRVLFLSATPIEDSYRQLWNQLDVFDMAGPFADLNSKDVDDVAKQRLAGKFLVRRVTALRAGGIELTKNQYRREWRRGGVSEHDQPVTLTDVRQRLTVALVQKKVTELLGSKQFGNRFQIGMLASFESFLETAKLKREDDAANFDGAEQAESPEEREGIDVRNLNELARDHVTRFDCEMAHPKMDGLVASLRDCWDTGRKALVFVRRVASVKELKLKLDKTYDDWVLGRLRQALPASLHERFIGIERRYREARVAERLDGGGAPAQADTFFAWFFRGAGPQGVISGANVQRRFTQAGTVLATFFEENYVASLLDARPGQVLASLAISLGRSEADLREDLRLKSAAFLGQAKKIARKHRFDAVQAAAIEILHESPGPWQEAAKVLWAEKFHGLRRARPGEPPAVGDYLEVPTFFTELRARGELRQALWPAGQTSTAQDAFRDQELRAQLLGRAARLGHAFIDFYILFMQRLGSFELRSETEETDHGLGLITAYLDLLDRQRGASSEAEAPWRAYDELRHIADNFDLIVDVNLRDAAADAATEWPRALGELLGEQQPVAGMSGSVNRTVVQQFRMPGYPFVLVSTDILQEGEDLHTFCSSVHHYGISWTPSAMEQRIGRIDRVRSQTERRLTGQPLTGGGEDLLQVYFPHLEDTVEVLQVRRVLARMNTFLRLMHHGLGAAGADECHLDVARELTGAAPSVELITSRLETAFPVAPAWLSGRRKHLATDGHLASAALKRFRGLMTLEHVPGHDIRLAWEPPTRSDALLATARIGDRQQPFGLYLRIVAGRLVVRCISPVGDVSAEGRIMEIKKVARLLEVAVGAVQREGASYDLTVEDDVVLASAVHDLARVASLINRVVPRADAIEDAFLEIDAPLSTFALDLEREYGHAPKV